MITPLNNAYTYIHTYIHTYSQTFIHTLLYTERLAYLYVWNHSMTHIHTYTYICIGDTPILSLLKDRSSNNSGVSVKTKNELIKLLIKFGAGK